MACGPSSQHKDQALGPQPGACPSSPHITAPSGMSKLLHVSPTTAWEEVAFSHLLNEEPGLSGGEDLPRAPPEPHGFHGSAGPRPARPLPSVPFPIPHGNWPRAGANHSGGRKGRVVMSSSAGPWRRVRGGQDLRADTDKMALSHRAWPLLHPDSGFTTPHVDMTPGPHFLAPPSSAAPAPRLPMTQRTEPRHLGLAFEAPPGLLPQP